MAISDMYKSDGKENLLVLNKANSAAQYPGASIYADGAVYTSDSTNWDTTTVKEYTAETLPDPSLLVDRSHAKFGAINFTTTNGKWSNMGGGIVTGKQIGRAHV